MLRFRAWDKAAKVMIYHIEQTCDGLGDFQENENIEDYVSDISFGCFADWLENDQFVIMQSTGLFDKNGKEIFEGDVLRDSESIVIVKFVDGAFSVDYRNMGGEWRNYGSLFRYLRDFEGEIIGNVFEHKELVEELK